MEVRRVCSVPKDEFLVENSMFYCRIDGCVLLQTLRALGWQNPRRFSTSDPQEEILAPMPCPHCRTIFQPRGQ